MTTARYRFLAGSVHDVCVRSVGRGNPDNTVCTRRFSPSWVEVLEALYDPSLELKEKDPNYVRPDININTTFLVSDIMENGTARRYPRSARSVVAASEQVGNGAEHFLPGLLAWAVLCG